MRQCKNLRKFKISICINELLWKKGASKTMPKFEKNNFNFYFNQERDPGGEPAVTYSVAVSNSMFKETGFVWSLSPSSSSSSSSLGQSRPTAGKAKRATHFAALSSEVGSDDFL